jgi:hypothetical protein
MSPVAGSKPTSRQVVEFGTVLMTMPSAALGHEAMNAAVVALT